MQVLVEVTIEADEAVLGGAVEDDEAVFTGRAFCEVVLEQAPEHEVVVTAVLFIPRYMTRPTITAIAMTTAATTAAATPGRDSNFNSTDRSWLSWLAITLCADLFRTLG